jgi:hypothetical protein
MPRILPWMLGSTGLRGRCAGRMAPVPERGRGAATLPARQRCLARSSAEYLLRSGPASVWPRRHRCVRMPRGSTGAGTAAPCSDGGDRVDFALHSNCASSPSNFRPAVFHAVMERWARADRNTQIFRVFVQAFSGFSMIRMLQSSSNVSQWTPSIQKTTRSPEPGVCALARRFRDPYPDRRRSRGRSLRPALDPRGA